jgi:hypothetical protein
MKRKILLLIITLAFLGCAGNYVAKPPKTTIMDQHIEGSIFKATENGFYTTELVLKKKKPVVGKNRGHMIVHNYEAVDTPGLKITAVLYMPETGAVSIEPTVVKGKGKGLYSVNNLYFDKPGKWELKMEIVGHSYSDTVVLELPEVKEKSEAEPEESKPIFGFD